MAAVDENPTISEATKIARALCPRWMAPTEDAHYRHIKSVVQELIDQRDAARREAQDQKIERLESGGPALVDLQDLQSDSIVAACNCITKTPDHRHHLPGCKYRLIRERDEARAEIRDLELEKAEMVAVLSAQRDELNQRLAERTAAYEARDAEQRETIRILRRALVGFLKVEAPDDLAVLKQAIVSTGSFSFSAERLAAIDALLATA